MGSHSNPVPRIEKKMPATKHMTNHFNLVLKLRDEASRTSADHLEILMQHERQRKVEVFHQCDTSRLMYLSVFAL